MKKILLVLTIFLVGCSVSNNTPDSIIERGYLIVGVKDDVPNFGLLNTEDNSYQGYEIDLAHKIAENLLGDASKVKFVPVTAKTRGPLLDISEVDMVIATFTISEARKEIYNFTTPYYIDSVGMLVKKDRGFTSLEDMKGVSIGVAQSATSKDNIKKIADEKNIEISFLEFATYPELKAALDSGRIDAFSTDKSILSGYLDDSTTILNESFSFQEYGIATNLNNVELSDYLDNLIRTWDDTGVLNSMQTKWKLVN